MELIDRFKGYILSINKKDKIVIFYHAYCTDGLFSCIITSKAITKITKLKPKAHYHYTVYEITEEIIEYVRKNNITKAIFVDLSLDANIENLKKLGEYTDVLIIDHHKFNVDLNLDRIVFAHSELFNKDLDGSKYPASKLCYDLFSTLINIEELDWLAAVGLVGDMGYLPWKAFVNKVQNKYNIKIEDDVYSTEIGQAAYMLKRAKDIYEKDITFNLTFKAKNLFEIIQNEKLIKLNDLAVKERTKWIDLRDKVEKYGDLIIYEITPKYKIGSALSSTLNLNYYSKNTLIVISIFKNKDFMDISARDQRRRIKLNELLRAVVKDIPGASAGGHIPAAGCQLDKKYLEEFKKRLIQEYEKLSLINNKTI